MMFVEKPSQDSDVISRTQSNAFDQRLERLSQSFRTLQENFLSELTPSPDRQGLHANATSINEIDARGFTYDDVVETKKIANICKRCGEQQFESICSCERSFLFKKDLSRNEAPIPDSCNSSLLSEYGSFRSKIPKSLPVRTSSSVSTNTYLRSTDTEKESFHSHDNTQSQQVPEPPPTVLAMHEYNEKLLQEALKSSGISLTRSDTLHELVTGKLAESMSWPFCPDRSDSSGKLSHGRIPKCTGSSHLTTRSCIFFGSEITDLHVLIRNTLKLFFPNPHRSDDETHVLAEEVIEAIEGNLGTLPQDYREIMESQHAVLDRTKWKQWAKQSYEARFDLITDGVHFVLTVLISYFGNKSTFVSRMYPGERVVAKQAPAVADIHSVSPDTSMCQKDASVHEKRKAKALILPRQIREGPNTLQSTHDVCHTPNTTVLDSPSFMEWNSSHSTPQRTRAVWKRSLIIAQESIHPGGVSEFLLDPFHVPQHNNNKGFTREGRENDYHCELEDVSPINPAVK